ncbi:Rieske 2Fe-2S domain-containing protein [bacterium]|nr:Rieske 2Fe-2S domain-containing protein [bacterium]
MQTLALKSPGRNGKPARVRLCALDDLPVGLGRPFVVEGRTIAVFRARDGKVFATDNACPHKNGPLADGMLVGHQVVCPLHAFRFGTDGECDQPNVCAVATYPVEVEGAAVFITLPAA